MIRVRVDFNAELPGERFFALARRLERPVSPGELLQAYDEDGARMTMTVDEIDDRGLVYLVPDWSTWTDDCE